MGAGRESRVILGQGPPPFCAISQDMLCADSAVAQEGYLPPLSLISRLRRSTSKHACSQRPQPPPPSPQTLFFVNVHIYLPVTRTQNASHRYYLLSPNQSVATSYPSFSTIIPRTGLYLPKGNHAAHRCLGHYPAPVCLPLLPATAL